MSTESDSPDDRLQAELTRIEAAIAAQKGLRGIMPAADIETHLASLREKQAAILAKLGDGSAAASGAGATAVAARGVFVGGNMTGSIFTGDIQGNIYIGEPTADPAEALRIYRRVLMQTSGALPLRGLDMAASDPTQARDPLRLAQVYVALDTTTRVEERSGKGNYRSPEQDSRPVSALEATVKNQKLVLLGDPGGGKSTFVNHLAYCLAAQPLQPEADWLARLPGWPVAEGARLPIVGILRDFARQLPDPLPAQADVNHLWAFITSRLAAQNLEFAAKPIQNTLEAGEALLLFDGLDEVIDQRQRAFVRDAIVAFTSRYPQNRCLVTCRVLSYQETSLRLPARYFPSFELAAFDEEKVDNFIHAWYAELAQARVIPTEEVERLAQLLQQALRRPDLWRLATNPLLLTVIALVNTHSRLPDTRALLYEETINILLWQWDKVSKQAEVTPLHQLLQEAGRSDIDLKRVLGELAFTAQAQSGQDDELADIGALALLRAIAALNNDDLGWAQRLVEVMKLRAGLLVERAPDLFTFPHRTFQEYLAGTHLAAQPDFALATTRLARQGTAWRELILLAVGYLVYVGRDTHKPLALAAELCPGQIDKTEPGWRNVWLAGDVLNETGIKRVRDTALGRELQDRTQERLAELLQKGKLSPRERLAAGDTLARLGDPRDGACTLEPDLVHIPAGVFLMGGKPDKIHLAAFAIARYPVTNAQFRFFIEEGGYKYRDYWTKEGWQYRQEGDWTEPRLWDNDEFNQANQPVVGVSWYEAVAYGRWLSQRTYKTFRLPTEAEWERAARHTDGRRYPWGDTAPQPETTNFGKTGLERPCAVGSFPQDTAVDGVQDMSGNVNEWCQTRWHDESGKEYGWPYVAGDGREKLDGGENVWRVIRGGSYYNDEKWLRCASRLGYDPYLRYSRLGFRVVCVPISSLASEASDL